MTKTVDVNKLKGLDNEITFASDTVRIMMTNLFKVPEDVRNAAWTAMDAIGLETFKNVYKDMCAALGRLPFPPVLGNNKFVLPDNGERYMERMAEVVLMVRAAVNNRYFYDTRETHRNAATSQLDIATSELAAFIEWSVKTY